MHQLADKGGIYLNVLVNIFKKRWFSREFIQAGPEDSTHRKAKDCPHSWSGCATWCPQRMQGLGLHNPMWHYSTLGWHSMDLHTTCYQNQQDPLIHWYCPPNCNHTHFSEAVGKLSSTFAWNILKIATMHPQKLQDFLGVNLLFVSMRVVLQTRFSE